MKKATKIAITSISRYAQHGLAPVAPQPGIQHIHIRASGVYLQHAQIMIALNYHSTVYHILIWPS